MERLAATLVERDVILVEGSDSVSYLHTQLTQDVESMEVGASAWSFLLEPKSEIVALLRVTRTSDAALVLDTEPGFGGLVRDRIDGFLFRMDVRFSSATWPGVSWRGPGSDGVSADAPIVMRTPWPGVEGVDVVGPEVGVPGDADIRDAIEFESMRIRMGWPVMADLDERTTPAMTGIVDHTVSFTKGCYTGQELVARVHYRGAKPTRSLVQVGFHPCAKPVVGDPILIDGAEVGRLTSVSGAQPLALGYVDRAVEIPGEAHLGATPICMGVLPVAMVERKAPPPKRTSSPLTLS